MQKQAPYLNVVLSVIGLIVGTGLYIVSKMGLSSAWEQGVMTFLIILGLFIGFVVPHRQTGKLMLAAIVIAGVYSYVGVYSIQQDFLAMSVASVSLLPLSLYMVFCFFYVYFEQEAFRFPYESLFLVTWSSIFILCLSLFFTLLCWALLSLIAFLFKNIGFDFLDTLFYSAPFSYILSGGLIGLGIAIGREHEKLIASLRRILLALCYFLLPVFSAFGILYLILLCFGKHKSDLDIYLYVNFSLIAIFLLNGTYQMGDQKAPYTRMVRWCVNTFFFLFPVFPLLLLSDMLVKMTDPNYMRNFYCFFVYAVLLFAYSVGYFIALFSSKRQWFLLLKRVNVILAMVVIIVSLGLHTPLFDYAYTHKSPYENTFHYH